ncbi:MAG: GNAT family N-acetyltransferase [Myxococcales bacterium]|nr:GNAT family N-acetyltransferase [Myxococcales bacterium]
MRTRPERPHDPAAGALVPTVRRATPADAPRLAWIRTSTWRATYAEIIGPHALERISRHDGERMRRAVAQQRAGHAVWVIEDHQGTVFGYAWIGPQTDRSVHVARAEHDHIAFLGEVYELYLHPRWHGRGAGTTLLVHAIWDLVDAGLHPVMLWVLGENTAQLFYESTGGVRFATREVEVGGRAMQKVAYGWHEQLPLP